MIVKVKKIGNSKGIILPKNLMEMCEIEEQVSLTVENNHIVIAAAEKPRAGWEEQFKVAISETKEPESDYMLHISNDFDQNEWTW